MAQNSIPISIEEKERAKEDFINWEKHNDVLPIHFTNGKSLDHFDLSCPSCHQSIPEDLIRIKSTWQSHDCIMVEMIGMCEKCKSIVRKNSRFKDDLSSDTFSAVSGAWKHQHNKENILSRLIRAITFNSNRKINT